MKYSVTTLLLGGALMATAAHAETTIRFAHMNSPTHFVNVGAEAMAAGINERTNGEVKLEVFPSGQLGENGQIVEQISLGSDLMGQVGSGGIASYVPDFDILLYPFMYENFEQAKKLLTSDLFKDLEQQAEEKANVKVMCYVAFGMRDLYTRDTEVHAPEDMKGLKMRVQPITIYTEMVKQVFDASPTPMPWPDVYSALSQGVIDAAEAPPSALLDQKHYEGAKYLIQTNHIVDIAPVVMSASQFNGLTKEQQAIVSEETQKGCDMMSEISLGGYESDIEEVKAHGMTVISDFDRSAFVARASGIAESFPAWSPNLYERARAILDN